MKSACKTMFFVTKTRVSENTMQKMQLQFDFGNPQIHRFQNHGFACRFHNHFDPFSAKIHNHHAKPWNVMLVHIYEKVHQKSSSFSHAQKPMKMFNLQCLYQKTIIFVCSIVMQNKSKIQNVTFAWKCIFFTQAHNSSVAKGLGFKAQRRRHKILLWLTVSDLEKGAAGTKFFPGLGFKV